MCSPRPGGRWRLGGHQALVDTGSIGLGELVRQVIGNEVATSQ